MTRNTLLTTAALWLSLAAFGCSKPAEPAEPSTPPEQEAAAPSEDSTSADAAPTTDEAPEPQDASAPSDGVDAAAQQAPDGSPVEQPAAPEQPDPGEKKTSKTGKTKAGSTQAKAATNKEPRKTTPVDATPPTPAPPPPKPVAFKVKSGSANFLIDAPLEKIKGTWSGLSGELTVNPSNLLATRGEVTVPLKTLKTTTFGSASQNATQTGHALNWMEVEDRADYAVARFRIERVTLADPKALSGDGPVRVKLAGRLRLHGVESPKQVEATVSFSGDPSHPSGLTVKTTAPLRVSLKEHDIKPRDLAGKFLAGAMAQIGQKIADTAQVHINFTAASTGVQE